MQLHQAMRYSLFPGGKRIRPLLTLATANALNGRMEDALPAAAAIECIHSYTLIHDDLPCMDDDDTRRGRPTCHIQYGEATALLAGDALLALGFALAARSPIAPSQIVTELAEAAGSLGVVGGQVADLAAAASRSIPHHELTFIHTHKTASLFRAAIVCGALAAGCARTDPTVMQLDQFALALGLAFQYVDDLLDAEDTAKPGKDFSSVACLGIDGVRAEANRQTELALSALQQSGADTQLLEPLTDQLLRRPT